MIRDYPHLLYADAFDGQYLYTIEPAQSRSIRKEVVAPSFRKRPEPFRIFSILSGLPLSYEMLQQRRASCLNQEHDNCLGPRQIYRFLAPGKDLGSGSDWLLGFRQSDQALLSVTACERGHQLFSRYRIRREMMPHPPSRWDLATGEANIISSPPESVLLATPEFGSKLLTADRVE
jgi:hypothetical protein